ncbi:MAG: response regulator transcription factor [Actinomycetaceae bacterium]|nr:response regulator transcription factor [Actinomycetaceae bacterium]
MNTQSLGTVLLVDDEEDIRTFLSSYLTHMGYSVITASDGVEALGHHRDHPVDIVVTDVLMPRMDGRELVRRLRQEEAWTPVIMLTQVTARGERIAALDEGADDYLSKPFDPDELISRIGALLRRVRRAAPSLSAARTLTCGSLVLDRVARVVTVNGVEVSLTPKAVNLLDHLMCHPGELLSRDRLLEELWGIDFATSTRAVDHRIRELRRVLDSPGGESLIETVPSGGYRFRGAVYA